MASEHNRLGLETNGLNFPDQSPAPLTLNVKNWKPCLLNCLMIHLQAILQMYHLFSLHNLTIFPNLTHLDKPQQLLQKTDLQLNLHQQQNKSLPTPNTAEDLQQQLVPKPADSDPNLFFNSFAPALTLPDIAESSTRNLDPSNLYDIYQHHSSTYKWTRDYPLV